MSAFGDAFKAAKAAGKKVFTFEGKKFHTRTADEEKASSKAKSAGVPKRKPSKSKRSGSLNQVPAGMGKKAKSVKSAKDIPAPFDVGSVSAQGGRKRSKQSSVSKGPKRKPAQSSGRGAALKRAKEARNR